MSRVLPVFLLLTLQIYALVDILRSSGSDVRNLPKGLWLVVWLLPVVGPVAWLIFGKPRVGPSSDGGGGGGGGGIIGGPRPSRGPVAPDDDPEFLKRLDEQSWASRMERLRRERESGGAGPQRGPAEGSPGPETAPGDGVQR